LPVNTTSSDHVRPSSGLSRLFCVVISSSVAVYAWLMPIESCLVLMSFALPKIISSHHVSLSKSRSRQSYVVVSAVIAVHVSMLPAETRLLLVETSPTDRLEIDCRLSLLQNAAISVALTMYSKVVSMERRIIIRSIPGEYLPFAAHKSPQMVFLAVVISFSSPCQPNFPPTQKHTSKVHNVVIFGPFVKETWHGLLGRHGGVVRRLRYVSPVYYTSDMSELAPPL